MITHNKFKLEAYAAFTAAFLSGEKLSSQIIMQDFDPDLRMMNWTDTYIGDDSVLIDIDSNGVFDLLFYYDISGGGDVELYVQIQDAVTAIYADENGYVLPLESDGIVWPFLFNWKSTTQIVRSIYISTYNGYYTSWCNSSGNGNTFNNDYIPIKLNFDDGIHYGWIRLSTQNMSGGFCNLTNIGSPLVVYDIAYNEIAEDFINCDAKVGHEMIFSVSDINDHDNFSEFSLQFNYEDIPGLKEMRFYFIPERLDCINFSVEQAMLLPENRYLKILPDDAGIEEGESNFSPSPDMLDINGDPFQSDHFYSVMMLSVPTDTAIMRYHLTVPTKVVKAIDNSCSLGVASVEVKIIRRKPAGYSGDMILHADADENDLSVYKIGFYDECYYSEIFNRINDLDLDHLPSIIVTGKEIYQCHFENITTDIFGEALVPGNSYNAVLIGIGDGANRDGFCFAINCDNPVCLPSDIAPDLNNDFYSLMFENGILTINLLRENTSDMTIQLLSVNGQNIFTVAIDNRISKFDLSNLSQGIYFASIYSSNEIPGVNKIYIK